jgi:DNA-directed RNA polymerase specialized sigma24 family protein
MREVRVRADAEAYVALYDSQAVRLHAYCWSLVGDQAAAAVRDVFTAAAHPYMAGRTTERRQAAPGRLWLYRQARAECLRRGPVTVTPGRDPLLRAANRLRADQREVLVLAADLPPAGIAHVLGVTPDRAVQLYTAARTRLEQAVLKVLLANPATATHEDVIGAFERGALGALLARRAPAPPPGLRAALIGNVTRHRETPLVVISPPAKATHGRTHDEAHDDDHGAAPKGRQAGRHARVAAPVIGVAAACAAAVVGALAAGGTLNFDASPAGGGEGHGAMPQSTAEHARSGQAAAPGSGRSPVDEVSPTGSATPRPLHRAPGDVPSPAASGSPTDPPTPSGTSSPDSPDQIAAAPEPAAGSPSESTPSSPSAPPDSSSPDPQSPSATPSASPPGNLLPGLPLLPKVLGDAIASVTGGG